MLRYKADRRTIGYMIVTTAMLIFQWMQPTINWWIYPVYLFLSIAVTVIAHNHNHLPIFRNSTLNHFTDYWLTVFYGFPAFGWIPTHNKNHHALNNKEGDYTITYRLTEQNHLLMLLIYPMVSSYHQQKPIRDYLKELYSSDRRKFWLCAMQYVALGVWIGAALLIDWRKALMYVIIPQQVGLFAVLVFNFVQHVHADEESPVNHSRNFTGILNLMLFNNGFHTVHHDKAGTHWSLAPKNHAAIADKIDPSLIERSIWWYLIRTYILGAVIPKFRTRSMRLDRLRETSRVAA